MPKFPIQDTLNRGLAHHQAGRLGEAEACYRQILQAEPNHADAWHLLGLIAHQSGRFDLALESIGRALQFSNNAAVYLNNFGITLMALNRPREAEAAYRAALAQEPGRVDWLQHLAKALHSQGKLDETLACYQAVLALQPDDAQAYNNIGVVRQEQGALDEGAANFKRALELAPGFAEAYNNLGYLYGLRGDRQAAIVCYHTSLAINPQDFVTLNNLGVLLNELGQFSEAETCFRAALAIRPDFVEARNNLGMPLRETARHAEAIGSFRAALALNPRHQTAYRNLLSTLLYQSGVSQASLYAEHRQFEAVMAAPLYAQQQALAVDFNPGKRLRVAWLSSDFHHHPIARNIGPLLKNHRAAQFEHVLYADVAALDETSLALKQSADAWHSIYGLTDPQVAAQMRADKIDILICLAGHFDRNRPLVCALKPAPLQVSFHDIATSGMTAVDYLISDIVMTPKHGAEQFTERVVRLPVFYIHAPLSAAPAVAALPASRKGYVTFGNFGNPAKLNSAVIALWARVLAAAPDSRLALKYKQVYADAKVRAHFEAQFAQHGVDGARIVWHGASLEARDHLTFYHDVDITLDSFPFNGSTTTFESLWMGVPVLTLAGENMVGRWGMSMLRAARLNDWVARSEAEFVEKAAGFAAGATALADLRAGLRARIAASPLCDERGRARQFERLLRALWRRKCAEIGTTDTHG